MRKVDAIYMLLTQWNNSDMGSGQKSHPYLHTLPTPPPSTGIHPTLTTDDVTLLKNRKPTAKLASSTSPS
jgi:hypothetical protein